MTPHADLLNALIATVWALRDCRDYPGIAVLAYPAFGSHYLCGRVALLCDAEGLAHARSPVDWC